MERLNAQFWKKRKVFVTGATGIVGSWLVKDLLRLKAKVTALIYEVDSSSELYRSQDIRRIKALRGRLEDYPKLKKIIADNKIDTVFHLGAQAIVKTAYHSPLPTFEANIRGTYNLLEACRSRKNQVKHIVIASSDKAYGEQPHLPYKEGMPLIGRFPYEVSKSCCDLLAQSYFHSYGLPVAIVRCGNIYGGGDLNWNRIVPGTIRSFFQNKPLVIRSDGTYIRDYVYVKDVSYAYMLTAEGLKNRKIHGEAFNISGESPFSVLQLVARIQKLMNCQGIKPKILNTAKGEIRSQYLSSHKIQKTLKWKPRFTLDQGLKETIDWYDTFFTK